jgi:maltooligosyltrehalose trehalohydrolase
MKWKIEFSTENPKYGGCGTPALDTEEGWQILAYSAALLTL